MSTSLRRERDLINLTIYDDISDIRVVGTRECTVDEALKTILVADEVQEEAYARHFSLNEFKREDDYDYVPVIDRRTGSFRINPKTGKPFVARKGDNVVSVSGLVHRVVTDDLKHEMKRFEGLPYIAYSNCSGRYIDEEELGFIDDVTTITKFSYKCPIDEYRHRIPSMEKQFKLNHLYTYPACPIPVRTRRSPPQCPFVFWENYGTPLDWRDFPRDDEGEEMAENGSCGVRQEAEALMKEELRNLRIGPARESERRLIMVWEDIDPLIQDGTLKRDFVEESFRECGFELGLDSWSIMRIFFDSARKEILDKLNREAI